MPIEETITPSANTSSTNQRMPSLAGLAAVFGWESKVMWFLDSKLLIMASP
jgi:hypothetical protein